MQPRTVDNVSSHPEVSVLIPLRLPAPWLTSALWSVLRSRDVDLEIVVVTHGFEAPQAAELDRYRHDKRFRFVYCREDADLGGVLEVGRRQCHAPFIARMDADDLMHSNRLVSDVTVLRADDSLAAVCCRIVPFPSNGLTTGMRRYTEWMNSVDSDDLRDAIFIEQPLCHPSVTLRASALDAIGGYRQGPFPEDYDLFMRLLTSGCTIVKRSEVHFAWRDHGQRATRTDPRYVSHQGYLDVRCDGLARRFFADGDRRAVIVGAGKQAGRLCRALLARQIEVEGFVDVKPSRIGGLRIGRPVLPVSAFVDLAKRHDIIAVVVVGIPEQKKVISQQLDDAGFVIGENAIFAA